MDIDKEVAKLLLKQKALGLNNFQIVKDNGTDEYIMCINKQCNQESLDIPSYITSVSSSAQANDEMNTILREVNINCEVIDSFAFLNFKGIEKVNIGPDVRCIRGSAFAGTSKLKEIDLSKYKIKSINGKIAPNSGVERIILPETLIQINYAFMNMPKLQEIDMSRCEGMNKLVLNALNLTGSCVDKTLRIKLHPNLKDIPKGSIIKSYGRKLIIEIDTNSSNWKPLRLNGVYNDDKIEFRDTWMTGREAKK